MKNSCSFFSQLFYYFSRLFKAFFFPFSFICLIFFSLHFFSFALPFFSVLSLCSPFSAWLGLTISAWWWVLGFGSRRGGGSWVCQSWHGGGSWISTWWWVLGLPILAWWVLGLGFADLGMGWPRWPGCCSFGSWVLGLPISAWVGHGGLGVVEFLI